MKKKLVLCTGNSCRSQMAEGFLKFFANEKAEVFSAGMETHGVNPRAIACMLEDGIDISSHTSNHVNDYIHLQVDYLITICDHAKERCPIFSSSTKKIHINFPDPAKAKGTKDEIEYSFRAVRNQIRDWCSRFVEDELR